jgi:CTP-dependent riboflavin kinase
LLKRVKDVVTITPVNDFYPGSCFKVYFNNLECAVIIPRIPNYPENILEIISYVDLRKTFNLYDGQIVEVKVELI